MLKRQNSATSWQFALTYGVIVGVILGTASLCALAGAWLVLPCAIVETLAIGGTCWLYARRERGYDCIELFDGALIVVRTDGKRVDRAELNPLWVKVALGTGRNPRIEIRYAGSTMAVGGQVPLEDRQRVAAELNQALFALRACTARQPCSFRTASARLGDLACHRVGLSGHVLARPSVPCSTNICREWATGRARPQAARR